MASDFLPTFMAASDKRVPEGQCAVFWDDKMVYAGPINRCPTPAGGSVMYINPTDFKDIENRMQKLKH